MELTREGAIVALIAVHNRLALTRRCLGALRAATAGFGLKVMVVDDGSTDGTTEWLALNPDIETLHGDGNLWFGGATDLGLRHILEHHTEASHVLILNNDTFLHPGALDALRSASKGATVAAAAYWTEDLGDTSSAGFLWRNWKGLNNVCETEEWINHHRAKDGAFMPVDAIATTVVLIPVPLLRAAVLPDPRLHPHNRYDALLSARLRAAGGDFICSTEFLADHLFGKGARASTRTVGPAEYLAKSLGDRKSVWHLAGGCALDWEAAPGRAQACWAIARRGGYFAGQFSSSCAHALCRTGRAWFSGKFA